MLTHHFGDDPRTVHTRSVSGVTTTRVNIDPTRLVTDIQSKIAIASSSGETTLELDSHADTCILGCDALITLDYNRPVSVVGYDPNLGSRTYKTVSGVVAYDEPATGSVYHLVTNQAIQIPHLDHHLLCPMQCRVNDVIVKTFQNFWQDLTLLTTCMH